MLMREASPHLAGGAYLIGVGPEAESMPYLDLRAILFRVLELAEKS
jgi:hypothetical protein